MCGAISPLPKDAFMAWLSLKKKHKGNFTFFFTSVGSKISLEKPRLACGR
jgi:hypothetical protein